ncbi:hypothetical protein EG831_10095, partial [bacterium]|nr:hypothetical protein [bacterium]
MRKTIRKFKTVLVPIGEGRGEPAALALARTIAEEVVLVGVVPIGAQESLSGGMQKARQVRKRLLALGTGPVIRFKSSVIVSEMPWQDLQTVLSQEKPDLLMIDWQDGGDPCGMPIAALLSSSLCDVALVRGAAPVRLGKTLIAVRGGPYAELAFQLGMRLGSAQLDVLHLSLAGAANDAPFKGLMHILPSIPEAKLRSITTDDTQRTILEEARSYDLVILGVTAGRGSSGPSIGPVAEKLLRESPATVVVVKTRRPMNEAMFGESAGARAIS